MFSGAELGEFLRLADYVAVNDYEGKMLEEKTGRKLEDDRARRRRRWSARSAPRARSSSPAVNATRSRALQAEAVVDPTGCGDAYRAGLLYGIARGWDWPSTGKLGSVMGAIKIAQRGAQNHSRSRDDIEARFRSAFGYSPWKG